MFKKIKKLNKILNQGVRMKHKIFILLALLFLSCDPPDVGLQDGCENLNLENYEESVPIKLEQNAEESVTLKVTKFEPTAASFGVPDRTPVELLKLNQLGIVTELKLCFEISSWTFEATAE